MLKNTIGDNVASRSDRIIAKSGMGSRPKQSDPVGIGVKPTNFKSYLEKPKLSRKVWFGEFESSELLKSCICQFSCPIIHLTEWIDNVFNEQKPTKTSSMVLQEIDSRN